MPRIPEAAVTVRLPTRVGTGPGPIVALGQQAARTLTGIAERRLEAQQRTEFTKLAGDLEGQLTDLQLDIQRDPSANTVEAAEARFAEGAAQISQRVLGQAQWDSTREALQARMAESSHRARVAVSRTAFGRETDASKAALDTATDQYERAYPLAGSDEERAIIAKNHRVAVNLNPYLTEQEKVARIQTFASRTDRAQVRGLIDGGRFDEAREILADPEKLRGLDENERLSLRRTLGIAEKRAETELKAAAAAAEKQRVNQLLRRFFDPKDPRGVPTVMDILDARLPRAVSEHFIGLVKKHAIGADINEINPNVYNDLYARIHDPNHPRSITDATEVLPFVGRGISPEKAELLRQDIEDLQSEDMKITNRLFNDFLDMAEAQISRTTFMGKDAIGERLFYEFRFAAQEMWDKGIEDGKNPRDLVNPSHQDYIGKIIDRYRRTDSQVFMDMNEEMGRLESGEELPPLRTEGESMEEWLQRQGQ